MDMERNKRKKTILMLTTMMMRRRQSFQKKLGLLFEEWRKNNEMLLAMASEYFRQTQEIVSKENYIVKRRRIWKFDRRGMFWETDVTKMDAKMFKDNFRVSKDCFEKICDKAIEMTRQDTVMRPPIPLKKRVAIALYAIGSSAEYRTVAHLFGVGRSTVGEVVLEFCKVICKEFAGYICSYPPTSEEVQRIVEGFRSLGFPQCYGAVDGCHVEIQPKKEEAVDFYNYKGWYSTILLAACDHRSKFTYLNIGSAGRNNDSYIFEKSSLKRIHETSKVFDENREHLGNIDVPVLLIGDSAFRLSRYMMKPYPFKLDQPDVERNFNYRLSKCRRVIENAFGQLKARFRKIGRGLEVHPDNCKIIIKACCLLHNFLKEEEDEVFISWMEEAQAAKRQIQPSSTTRIGDDNINGKAVRDAIAFALQSECSEAASDDQERCD